MDTIFEISNLLLVWFILVFFLKTPFFASIQNYITSEKNRRTSLEELFLAAKKRGDKIVELKKESQNLFNFVNNTAPENEFDTFPEFRSSLRIETIPKIKLESYVSKSIR